MEPPLTNEQRDVVFKRLLIRALMDRGIFTAVQHDELSRLIPDIAIPAEYTT
jgi:hypothetical protein